MVATISNAQEIDKLALRLAIERQLSNYPKSRLQDVYKAFYQEHFGSEHMISDTIAVRNYLNQELETMSGDYGRIFYEPIGVNGDYVRVNLGAVKVGLITVDELLQAFLDSAAAQHEPAIEWTTKWNAIIEVIDEIKPGFGADERQALQQASSKKQAVHHSQDYRDAYNPHYRIVEHTIFEMLLKPNL